MSQKIELRAPLEDLRRLTFHTEHEMSQRIIETAIAAHALLQAIAKRLESPYLSVATRFELEEIGNDAAELLRGWMEEST